MAISKLNRKLNKGCLEQLIYLQAYKYTYMISEHCSTFGPLLFFTDNKKMKRDNVIYKYRFSIYKPISFCRCKTSGQDNLRNTGYRLIYIMQGTVALFRNQNDLVTTSSAISEPKSDAQAVCCKELYRIISLRGIA